MRNRIVSFALISIGLGSLALAGPPLVCFPFDTGGQPSLSWGGQGWHESDPKYDTANLASDTVNLLRNDVSVIARMETLRRAGIYAANDPKAGSALLGALKTRVKNGGEKQSVAYALFDLGYFADTYRQASRRDNSLEPHQIDGYSLVSKAIEGLPESADIHFAAALMTADRKDKKAEHERHLQQAAQGAQEGSLLARNLVSHFQWRGKDLQSLRASVK
ncbi:MAG: hypothetical protein EHM61_03885 [Acidobacteria bacterium]|nr:MAG: hypothetical protein EHM61_03885 [Acidobacteriota bacterium]